MLLCYSEYVTVFRQQRYQASHTTGVTQTLWDHSKLKKKTVLFFEPSGNTSTQRQTPEDLHFVAKPSQNKERQRQTLAESVFEPGLSKR
jgi:hypothetical protein